MSRLSGGKVGIEMHKYFEGKYISFVKRNWDTNAQFRRVQYSKANAA